MTLDEAYQRGQRDMRNRIEKMWQAYITDSLGGHWRINRPGRQGYSDVSVKIRQHCKVLPLATCIRGD